MSSTEHRPQGRIVIVDLNNFARYPTLSVGYLVAALRSEGHRVDVISPLSLGVVSPEREGVENWRHRAQRLVYTSNGPLVDRPREALRSAQAAWYARPHKRTLQAMETVLTEPADVMLISTYLQSYAECVELSALAARRGVPVLIGGPSFNQPEVAAEWLDIPGLTAVVGAEVDLSITKLVDDVLQGGDLAAHPGVYLPNGRRGDAAVPLRPLANLPIPDFSDFPWNNYPHRIIPAMTGRGCSWGACTFCGDVVSVNGRTFRSRVADELLNELEIQSERHHGRDFVFTDIKANSDLGMWRGIIENLGRRLPNSRWVTSVHVDARTPNGLTRDELFAARASGLMRLTFGLETASEPLLARMRKGTDLASVATFIHDAHDAGISVRATAMVGYPGETAADLEATSTFLATHGSKLDRVKLSRFNIAPGTAFHHLYNTDPDAFPGLSDLTWDYRYGRGSYRYSPPEPARYRRATVELANGIHAINRKPLRDGAEQFDGIL